MKKMPHAQLVRLLGDALYAAITSTFAQGFSLIARAAQEEKWEINPAEVARIWQGGCIIRAKLLLPLSNEYAQKKKVSHFFLLPHVERTMKRDGKRLRSLVGSVATSGLAMPGFSSALFYFESMTEKQLPANVIAGLRDYFGTHGYERTDKPGICYTDWKI
jgi:6-phosphogluconate dehydrogenase